MFDGQCRCLMLNFWNMFVSGRKCWYLIVYDGVYVCAGKMLGV